MEQHNFFTQLKLSRNERRAVLILSSILLIFCILINYAERKYLIYNESQLSAYINNNYNNNADKTEYDANSNNPKLHNKSLTHSTHSKSKYSSKSNKKKSYKYSKKGYKQTNQIRTQSKKTKKTKYGYPTKSHVAVKDFNPNLITEQELKAFGINKFAAQNWMKYLAAGAKFNQAADLKKVYQLKEDEFLLLKDHIKIPKVAKPIVENFKTSFTKDAKASTNKRPVNKIAINKANVSQLQSLYGIGPVLADRILLFRDKLGGFHSIDQLKDVYGLPDSTFNHIHNKLKLIDSVNMIDLNRADYISLKRHPYISDKEAKILMRYKLQHGNFSEFDELQKLKIFDDQKLIKLKPYLSI